MQTMVTITMTLEEYAAYKELQAVHDKEHNELEAIRHDCKTLAQMVCRALKEIESGLTVHLGMYTATKIYDYAERLGGKKQ